MENLSRKRNSGDGGDDNGDLDVVDLDSASSSVVKRLKKPVDCTDAAAADLDEDIMSWLSLEGETMTELLKFLDADEGSSSSPSGSGSPVKFIENPYSSPLIFQSSCSYITINGNEESCGSSFSDWECSVMASVDVSGGVLMSNAGGGTAIEKESGEFCDWFQGGEWWWRLEEAAARGMMTAGMRRGVVGE